MTQDYGIAKFHRHGGGVRRDGIQGILLGSPKSASQSFEVDGKPWGWRRRRHCFLQLTLLDFTMTATRHRFAQDFRSHRIDHPAKKSAARRKSA